MFPVGDFIRTRSFAFVNWALIAVNVAVFLYTLTLGTRPDQLVGGFQTSAADRFLNDWGFEPACLAEFFGFDSGRSLRQLNEICPPGSRELVQPFTAMFLHAGWAHIIGNMLFLWIFGDNVEDRVGHGRYLVFYMVCGLVAVAAQTGMSVETIVPAVGASGAIAGVLGAYLVLYPTAMVQVVVLPLFFIPFFVPAVVLIGIWFVTQVFAGLGSIGEATAGTGIAWWAHIGGFLAGIVLIWFFRRPGRPRAPAF